MKRKILGILHVWGLYKKHHNWQLIHGSFTCKDCHPIEWFSYNY